MVRTRAISRAPAGATRLSPRTIVRDMVSDQPPTPPTVEELESWAGPGRVLRATEADLATWRLPQSAKAALILSGVPLLDELVLEVSFRATPTMYRLALECDEGPAWEY